MDVARRVVIASAGADSARTFVLTGTDRYGNTQSESITGVASGSSQYSVLDYLTVTSVHVDAATAGAITVGTNGVGSSEWVVDEFLGTVWALAGGISGPAGTTYTLEETYSDPTKTGTSLVASPYQFAMEPRGYVPPLVWTHTGIVGATGNTPFDYANHPVFAHRLTVNSGTGEVVMESIQAVSRH